MTEGSFAQRVVFARDLKKVKHKNIKLMEQNELNKKLIKQLTKA